MRAVCAQAVQSEDGELRFEIYSTNSEKIHESEKPNDVPEAHLGNKKLH
jgi:hypothetical protein